MCVCAYVCVVFSSQVKDVGGLLVLVLSMQESERVAAQLRGRAGRQGDPGETFTLVEINDPLVEASGITGMDAVKTLLQSAAAPCLSDHDLLVALMVT